ncbi:PilN domain-containing protein (plasmid) [Aminobacter sp. BA135]|uniref:PilN domain-containing protein n=1 Tax=Aminobacter sp. BA135 TaxID=537596 RepID=UPI003D78FF94
MSVLKDHITDLFDWWRHELRALCAYPFSKKRTIPHKGVSLLVSADSIKVEFGHAESSVVSRDASMQQVFSALQFAVGASVERVDICIHSDLILARQLVSHRLPARHARAMAELDLLAATPLELSQIHVVFADRQRAGCRYHVIKRKTLASALEAIRLSGLSVGEISITTDDGEERVDRLSYRDIAPRTREDRLGKLTSRTVVVLFLLVVAGTYAHALWRYRVAQTELDEQISAAQVQAKLARSQVQRRQTELDLVATIRHEKQNSPSLMRTWAELTRVLPDDAWLTDLQAKGNEVTISGFAAFAANLIEPLEASPLIASPDFTAPVVKVPGQEGERFAIKAKVVSP